MIEAVVTIGVASMMLSVGVAMIHLILRADRSAAKCAQYNQSLARLSDLLRQDIHAAMQAEVTAAVTDQPARLELTTALPATISYEIHGAALVRVETARGEGDAAKVRHRDVFRFAPASAIEFYRSATPGTEQGDRLQVTITRPHGLPPRADTKRTADAKPEAPGRTFQIQAILGRDHRFHRSHSIQPERK